VISGLLLLFTSCGQSLESHLERGEELLQKRKFEEAVMQFRAAVEIDKSSAKAHWGLARSYENQGKFIETIEELRKVANLAPDNLEAKAKLGNYYLLFEQPQIEEASKILEDIFKRDKNFIEGHVLRASIFSAQNKPETEVVSILRNAISLNKKRTETYLSLARYYMKINKASEAEEVIKEGIAANPKKALGYIEYGRFLTFAKRADEAEAKFKKAVATEPKSIEAGEALASYYLGQRKLEKAEQAYKDLIKVQENSPESRMDLANFYALINRGPDAIKTYEGILKDAPEYARARYKLAEIHLERKEFKKVNAEVEKLLAVNDEDAEALMLRARVKLQQNDAGEAVKDLEEVLKKQPSLQTALFYMTQARLALGQVDQARAFIGDLEKYHPNYRRTALLKIQSAFLAGEPETALKESNDLIRRVQNAFAINPYNAQELEELRVRGITAKGLAELQLGSLDEAEKSLGEVARLSPNSAGAKINFAKVYIVKRDLPKALELYEQALALDEKSFDALSGMVSVLIRRKEFETAKTKLEKAIKEAGKNKQNLPALHYLKSDVLTAEGNIEAAEKELKKSIELDAEYLPAYSAYAAILISRNQTDAAINQYKKVVEKKPSASVHTLIGMLQDAKQNFDEAEKSYRKALEINPETAIAANNLAWMIADQDRGNLDEALKLAQDTVNRNKNVAGYYDTLGWVNYKKGFYAQAVESFKKAVALDEADARNESRSANAGYRLRLGMALASSGDKESARREVATAIKKGGGDLNAKEIQEAKKALGEM
jgi:tetratricopeptide (TPR) repeat protein